MTRASHGVDLAARPPLATVSGVGVGDGRAMGTRVAIGDRSVTPKVCPNCFAPVSKKGNRCNTCGGRNRWATGKGSKRTQATPRQQAWNRKLRILPAVADGTGCAHHFKLPTPDPDVEPMGVCQKCGTKRLHSNVGTGFERTESPWRNWRIGTATLPDEMEFRLPPGYHFAGVAD